jgi:hypothetical protein
MTWDDYDPAVLVVELTARCDRLQADVEKALTGLYNSPGSDGGIYRLTAEVTKRFLAVAESQRERALIELHNGRLGTLRGFAALSELQDMELSRLLALGRH